jgi:hypothetical protein
VDYAKIDTKRLYKDYPETKSMGLSKVSIRGAAFLLNQKGIAWRQYIVKADFPKILFTGFDCEELFFMKERNRVYYFSQDRNEHLGENLRDRMIHFYNEALLPN